MTILGTNVQVMAFIMKKKKYKFTVDLHLEELSEVPFVNGLLFAKIRLLVGTFQEHSQRVEVKNHTVKWGQLFQFPCKMSANASTGILDQCLLRISIRKEIKGGRSYQKLGFIDLNLAEFAGAGLKSKRCLLEGYDTRHRQHNSVLRVSIKMHMNSGDIVFKVPSSNLKAKPITSQDDIATIINVDGEKQVTSVTNSSTRGTPRDDATVPPPTSVVTTASGSNGHGSLTKNKKGPQSLPVLENQQSVELDPLTFITDSGNSESSEPPSSLSYVETLTNSNHNTNPQIITQTSSGVMSIEMGHSRNSSNTSQMSKGSSYSSFSHSQHSRHSSDGDTQGHTRSSYHKSYNFNRIYQKGYTSSMKLKMPKSPDSENEIFSTPNCSVVHENEDDMQQDSGIEEFGTPFNDITKLNNYKIAKIHSTGNIPMKKNVFSLYDDYSNISDSSFHDNNELKRMKSMGNLSMDERSFGATPKDFLKLKKEFELKRFGMARMRSLTNLVFDENEHQKRLSDIEKLLLTSPSPTESKKSFNLPIKNENKHINTNGFVNNTSTTTFRKKKFSVGDTKYIGSSIFENMFESNLTRMKSLGTIPDILSSEPIEFDPFLTPLTNRRNSRDISNSRNRISSVPESCCHYQNQNDSDSQNCGSSDDDNNSNYTNDDVIIDKNRLNSNNNINQINEFDTVLLRTPFERGYRRSYHLSTNNKLINSAILRQSDGYFCGTQSYCNNINFNRNHPSSSLDMKTRSSMNDNIINSCWNKSTKRNPSVLHRRLLDGSQRQLSVLTATSPCNELDSPSGDTCSPLPSMSSSSLARRPSTNINPSSSSITMSETGSLDRMKSSAERRKKCGLYDPSGPTLSGQVEGTRVNPDSLIDELFKDAKLDQLEESAEAPGLQLIISSDGTASLGSHEIKSGLPGFSH